MLVVARGGDQALEQLLQVLDPAGSNSIVVIAAVEPRTKAVAWASAAPAVATTCWTPSVMSTMSLSPSVETRSSPL